MAEKEAVVVVVVKPTVSELVSFPKEKIVSILGGIYEHSTWVAEALVNEETNALSKLTTVTGLAAAMKTIVDDAAYDRKMGLLRSHPDLCERVGTSKMEDLTESSREEQSGAGLQSLTEGELAQFEASNEAYRDRFGFPFILAVRNATKFTVLAALEGRIGNTSETEFAQAISQVHKIAWMRLLSAVNTADAKGFLTCHVLDTANGCPAARMRIRLDRISPSESAGLVAEYVTNDDGRLEGGPALKGGNDMIVGVYVLTFRVSDYFASRGTYVSGMPFLDDVPVRFGINNPDEHYHVPLLVSPWSFSTYRGS